MSAKIIRKGTDQLANSIESLIALYAHRQASRVQLQSRDWDPRLGSLADDIDGALVEASKQYHFPEQLWMNIKVIIIERLTQKVQILRPGLQTEKVSNWLEIDNTQPTAFGDSIAASKRYEMMLENLPEHCKSRIQNFLDILQQIQRHRVETERL